MVALKLEHSEPISNEDIDPMRGPEPPRLTVLDSHFVSHSAISHRSTRRSAVRRAKRAKWETLWFSIAAMVVLLFLLVNGADALWRVSAAQDTLAAASPMVNITVHPGDTLWKYAAQYGSPDSYILDRVDNIARVNHLSSTTALTPGQHLKVPVTNPVVLARLQQGREIPVALLTH